MKSKLVDVRFVGGKASVLVGKNGLKQTRSQMSIEEFRELLKNKLSEVRSV